MPAPPARRKRDDYCRNPPHQIPPPGRRASAIIAVPGPEIQLRLWQNVAHGGAAAFAINGTFTQEDRQGIEAARPVFQWLAAHEPGFGRHAGAMLKARRSPVDSST